MLLAIDFLNFWAFLEDEVLINLHKVIELVPYGFRVHYLLSRMGPFFFFFFIAFKLGIILPIIPYSPELENKSLLNNKLLIYLCRRGPYYMSW